MKTSFLLILIVIFGSVFIPFNYNNENTKKIYINPKYKEEQFERQKMNDAIKKTENKINLIYEQN